MYYLDLVKENDANSREHCIPHAFNDFPTCVYTVQVITVKSQRACRTHCRCVNTLPTWYRNTSNRADIKIAITTEMGGGMGGGKGREGRREGREGREGRREGRRGQRREGKG